MSTPSERSIPATSEVPERCIPATIVGWDILAMIRKKPTPGWGWARGGLALARGSYSTTEKSYERRARPWRMPLISTYSR